MFLDIQLNLYDLVPGNWSQKIEGGDENKFEVKKISNTISETGSNITDYALTLNDTEITVTVTSNTTAIIFINEMKIPVEFIDEKFSVARSDYQLDDGTHVSLTVNPRLAFEMSIVKKNQRDIETFYFSKPTNTDLTWKELVVIFLISCCLTYLIRKFGARYLG